MKKNKRLFLSLSEEDLSKLDQLRTELGMNRSEYIRYIISGQTKILSPSIKYKELVSELLDVELDLKVIALKDTISSVDKLQLYTEIKEIKSLLAMKGTSGQLD